MQLSGALQNAGKHFETVIYPQRTHGVTGKLKQPSPLPVVRDQPDPGCANRFVQGPTTRTSYP
ncbi:MAG: hypothetical protein ACXW4A_08750 [Nitrospira sp.]